MADKQKRPPPPDQILKRGYKVDERGKIVDDEKSSLQEKTNIWEQYQNKRNKPKSPETLKRMKEFEEWMEKPPEERDKIMKEKQRRKKMIKQYTQRNSWTANAGQTPKKQSLKF